MDEKEINQQDNGETVMDINADDSMPGTSHLTDPIEDTDESEKLKNEVAEQKDKYLRLFAVFNKLRSSLQAKGLKAMESIKTEFDVEKHEAITEIPAPSKDLKGKVIDEVTKGYYLNDKIIRFAKVVVGK